MHDRSRRYKYPRHIDCRIHFTAFKLGSIKTVTGMILEEQPDIAYVHINEFSVQCRSVLVSDILLP